MITVQYVGLTRDVNKATQSKAMANAMDVKAKTTRFGLKAKALTS